MITIHAHVELAAPPCSAPPVASSRQRLLLKAAADLGRPVTTAELARRTGGTLGSTAHHLRKLLDDGHLVWAGEPARPGARQTYAITASGRAALSASVAALLTEVQRLMA